MRLWRRDLLPNQTRICYLCGNRVGKHTFTIEHVIPSNRGGSDGLDNLELSCHPCNNLKEDKTLEEFLKERPWLLFKLAKLQYKPRAYHELMKMRGIKFTLYRLIHKYL